MLLTKSRALLLALIFIANSVYGQDANQDFFRNSGKIYVVVAVIAVVLLGLLFFMFYMDRRISKLEKHSNENQD